MSRNNILGTRPHGIAYRIEQHATGWRVIGQDLRDRDKTRVVATYASEKLAEQEARRLYGDDDEAENPIDL